jgi:hypothetical protein
MKDWEAARSTNYLSRRVSFGHFWALFLVHFGESFVDFGLSLAADRLRNIAEDVKAFTLEIVFDVTQRAQRGTSQGTAVVEPFQELVLHILYLNGGDPRMGFLVPFLGSIFDLFLDSALLVRDVFHGVLCDWTPVFGPFLDRFFTVHFIALLPTFGPVDLFGASSSPSRDI